MKVLVIGAHGGVGKRIVKKLNKHNHQVLAMVRKEEQKAEMEKLGATPVVADLEKDISHAYKNKLDAVVFTAGSGAGTGVDKTMAVDLQGARASINEAVKHHVPRYLMVSVLGANKVNEHPDEMRQYFAAKSEADQHLVQSDLDYTIFRPARLTDDPGTGSVMAAQDLDGQGSGATRRDDLAAAIVEALDKPNTFKKVIEIVDGNTPVRDAIASI